MEIEIEIAWKSLYPSNHFSKLFPHNFYSDFFQSKQKMNNIKRDKLTIIIRINIVGIYSTIS